MSWIEALLATLLAVLASPREQNSSQEKEQEKRTKVIAAGAADAKARFETAEKRFDEFRNRARLLSTAITFVVGIELTLVGRVIELRPKANAWLDPALWLFLASIALFVVTVVWQLRLLNGLIEKGYGTEKKYGLPNPRAVMGDTTRMDERAFYQGIGNSYANAAAEWEKANGELGPQIASRARDFARSMMGMSLVVLLLIVIVVLRLLGFAYE